MKVYSFLRSALSRAALEADLDGAQGHAPDAGARLGVLGRDERAARTAALIVARARRRPGHTRGKKTPLAIARGARSGSQLCKLLLSGKRMAGREGFEPSRGLLP